MASPTDNLRKLAAHWGILLDYYDGTGVHRHASSEVLLSVLRSLGVDIEREEDAGDVLARELRATWEELVEPCAVVWDERAAALELRVPADQDGPFEISYDGGRVSGRLSELPETGRAQLDGRAHVTRRVQLGVFPHGYHLLRASAGAAGAERSGTCLLISAPGRAWGGPGTRERQWGVFAPVYALHRDAGTGIGDLADLERLARMTGEAGGSLVGTLPLLALFLDRPCEYSPYSPVTRMFWNELYLPVDGDELGDPERLRALRGARLLEYREQMLARRPVLEARAKAAWADPATRANLELAAASDPRLEDYARFRAAVEAQGAGWPVWPERMRDGVLRDGDFDDAARRFHIWAQHETKRRLQALGRGATRSDGERGVELYLDLSVGVNLGGYDTWRDREVFCMDVSAGAPPDALFSQGQNWGLPPLHPRRLRHQHYRYFIDCIRAHMQVAGMLRIDHVMGLHRLYWVPAGVAATDGVYVYYRDYEMYAILSLESHRHQCALVGEDLGTVPDDVRPTMARHGMYRLYVAQFGMPSEPGQKLEEPPDGAVASLNTHDMPTFAGYWHGSEIDERVEMGLLDEAQADAARAERAVQRKAAEALVGAEGPEAVMRGITEHVAESDAELFLITLEDLWLEREPQNVPGTSTERPNWRRRMTPSLEEIEADAGLRALLTDIDARRRR